MCTNPMLIDNPYRGLKNIGLNRFHDCTSLKLKVPCGNCPTCIALRQMYLVQRCQMEQMDRLLFMCTLTYKNKMLRHRVVNGRKLYYADFSDVQKMFKRIRKADSIGRDFRYFLVNEYGGANHRPHFHFILSVERRNDDYYDILNLEKRLHDLFLFEWRRNVGTNWNPVYEPLCDYIVTPHGRTYDFHYVNPSSTSNGEDDVAFYVSKYLLKSSKWLDKLKSALKLNLESEDFKEEWKYLRCRCTASHNWGNSLSPIVRKYIKAGIRYSISNKTEYEYPLYFNRISGQSQPLAPYYQKKFLTVHDKEYYWLKNLSNSIDMIHDDEERERITKTITDYQRFQKVLSKVENNTLKDFYDYEDTYKNLSLAEIQLQDCILDSSRVDDDWYNYQDFTDVKG